MSLLNIARKLKSSAYFAALMLHLHNISLYQFRNYSQKKLGFTKRITAFCGSNGSGKTNLLEAIYYLSFAKNYFSRTEGLNVQHGLAGLRLEGDYTIYNEAVTITHIIRENNKKEFAWNGEEYKKLSHHLGKIPCVMVTPDDTELLTGNSDERRRFIDIILSQLNPDYLQNLIDYTKLLQQRNSLLKQSELNGRMVIDENLLAVLDNQIAHKGDAIYAVRKLFLKDFLLKVAAYYVSISGKDDFIKLTYNSPLHIQNMSQLLKDNRQKDFLLQRTTSGIHRDDIEILKGSTSFKTEASQGQRKTLLFAMKLAEWHTLKEAKGIDPILLLDDVFEKLDADRMEHLLFTVCKENNGQVFITDTHFDRLKEHFDKLDIDVDLIEL